MTKRIIYVGGPWDGDEDILPRLHFMIGTDDTEEPPEYLSTLLLDSEGREVFKYEDTETLPEGVYKEISYAGQGDAAGP